MIAAVKAVRTGAVRIERAVEAEYYRAEVDGLRGVAVVAVVAFHAFPAHVPGGFVGVDVFFVISGFLISSIILRQLERSAFTFSRFYIRRALRIFPALIVTLAVSLLIGAFILLPDELAELGKHLASASVFGSNFTLWQESGYFDRAADLKPLLHLWSLGVEEQFYLLWPLALLALWRVRQRTAVRDVLLLTLGSLTLAVLLGRIDSTANFYLPFSRFWELGLGCLLALAQHSPSAGPPLVQKFRSLSARTHSFIAMLGIGLIVIAVFAFDADTPFPGIAALMPTVGAMCVIAARSDAWFQRRVMSSGGLLFFGLISYPLYLWHWPLLSFATILESGEPNVSTRIVCVLVGTVLAWLTFKWIERPIRMRRRLQDAWILAVGLVIVGSTGLFIFAREGFPERFDIDVHAMGAEPRTDALCRDRFRNEIDFNYCKTTSSAPQPEALFLGDSRAQAVYDGAAAATGSNHALMLLARGGCPPLLNVDLHYRAQQGCSKVWKSFAKHVAEMRPPVVVIVGGGTDLMDPSVAVLESSERWHGSRQAAFKAGLRDLIVTLQKTSRVIYVTEFPPFPTAPSCFLRPLRLPGTQCVPTLARREVEAYTAALDRVVHELKGELPELQVVHSLSVLCDRAHCSQRLASGDVIYRDEQHLSTGGGQYFVRKSGLLGLLFDDSPPAH